MSRSGGSEMILEIALILLAIGYILQFIFVMVTFAMGGFDTKKEFLSSLIPYYPFYLMYKELD